MNKKAKVEQKTTEKPKNTRLAEQLRDKEIGGPKGPEPTRYGDWERKGRCIDF